MAWKKWISASLVACMLAAYMWGVLPLTAEVARASGALLFSDDFEGGDFATKWSAPAGGWSVVGDPGSRRLLRDSSSEEGLLFAGDPAWADYEVEMKMTYVAEDPGSTRASGLIARASGNSFYLFRIHRVTNRLELLCNINGTYTVLSRKENFAAPPIGSTYTLKLRAERDQLTAYLDGVEIFSKKDNKLKSGQIGFRAFGEQIALDDVKVTGIQNEVDRSVLQARIASAEALTAIGYPADTWQEFNAALPVAQAVYGDAGATQIAIDEQTHLLDFHMANLVPLPSANDPVQRVPYRMDSSNQAGWWSPLAVHEGKTYMAFIQPSTLSGFHTAAVVERDAAGNWRRMQATSNGQLASFPNDIGHNQPSLAVDGNGELHLFTSMHTDRWRYFKSDADKLLLLDASSSLPDQENGYTYPVVTTAPNGDVWLIVRSNSGNMAQDDRRTGKLYRYDHVQRQWQSVAEFANMAARSVYPDDLIVDADGNVHILFEWGPHPSSAMRHELSYIKYEPATGLFKRADGTSVAAPLTSDTADVLQPLEAGEDYSDTYGVQSAKMELDAANRPGVVYRYLSPAGPPRYVVKFAWHNGSAWSTEVLHDSSATTAAMDITQSGSEWRIYYVLSAGSDRVVAAVSGSEGWQKENVAPGKTIARLSAVRDGGTDRLYLVSTANESLYYAEAGAAALDMENPQWPNGSTLTASDITQTAVKLSWPNATDNTGVTGYRIYRNDQAQMTVSQDVYTCLLNNLGAGMSYTFKVTAYDAAGNESDPLSIQAATARPWSGGGSSGGSPALSDNANLDDLQIWDRAGKLELTPLIGADGSTAYTARTTWEQIEITAKPAKAAAKVLLKDQALTERTRVDLAPGVNKLVLVVQAENGQKKEYALTVYREASSSGEPANPPARFADIAGHWAENDIRQAESKGIISGYPDGAFRPELPVTRQEFAVMLVNGLKPEVKNGAAAFSDQEQIGGWAQQAVAQAVQAGIIEGYEDGSFRPTAQISRQEMMVIAARQLRAAGKLQGGAVEGLAEGFADAGSIAAYAKEDIAALVQAGIIQGSGGMLNPQGTATRAEAAVLLYRLMKL